jgi:hypothetical protein
LGFGIRRARLIGFSVDLLALLTAVQFDDQLGVETKKSAMYP